ncbi:MULTISPECIES: VfmB protein [Dickeya]|uniref:VfmB protein n=1 Tax=Dickeya aquatica TaxID=1401087 RepID=A0A375AGF2_9GAMM|nr:MULTISPECIES: VfmB protein [Dickeya]SLM65087.1 VfmB protein [Dickeya aquatica]
MSAEQLTQVWQAFKDNPLDEALACLLQPAPAAGYVHPLGYQIKASNALSLQGQQQPLFDRVLNHLGLEVVQSHETRVLPACFPVLVCAARLGLLARMQAMSWQHLSQRSSFGSKTTRHQLIKASFADVAGKAALLLEQQHLRLQQADWAGLEDDHYQITQLNNEAEKMMGGHGFLLGNTHSLSYFSMMLYSVYGKASCLVAA